MTSLWGKEEEIKTAQFRVAVEDIEAKYSSVFSDKINRITGKAPDKLQLHFMTTFDGYARTCQFRKDTYVPLVVQKEVYAVFKSIFSDKK